MQDSQAKLQIQKLLLFMKIAAANYRGKQVECQPWDDLMEQILTPEVKHPLKASQICATPTSYGLLFLPAKRLNLFLEPVARVSGLYTSERAASGY